MARAREATAQDHARMLAELRREVGRLVVQTTAAVTGKVLTPEDQRRLAEETARRLSTLHGDRERDRYEDEPARPDAKPGASSAPASVDGLLDESPRPAGRARASPGRAAAAA